MSNSDFETPRVYGSALLKTGLAEMLKGGVIMDVVNKEQAILAEKAGACAIMALERIPADIRSYGGVVRMTDPALIKEIMDSVSIPVMAKCRIGHFVEAQILESLNVDFIDESEVLSVADNSNHINKKNFVTPFVCGCRNLGEALRRISEGAAMIRTKGEAGTGDVVEAIKHIKSLNEEISMLNTMSMMDRCLYAKENRVTSELVELTADLGRLPVVNFAAGGIATPADAAMCMQLGVDGVFVGSGIFKSSNPENFAKAVATAVVYPRDSKILLNCSSRLGTAMVGTSVEKLNEKWACR